MDEKRMARIINIPLKAARAPDFDEVVLSLFPVFFMGDLTE